MGLGGTRWSCAQALEMETSALLREGDCGAREHSHQRSLRGQRLPAQYPFKRPLDFGFPRSRSWGEHSDVSYFSGGEWKKNPMEEWGREPGQEQQPKREASKPWDILTFSPVDSAPPAAPPAMSYFHRESLSWSVCFFFPSLSSLSSPSALCTIAIWKVPL